MSPAEGPAARDRRDWGRRLFTPGDRRIVRSLTEALFCDQDASGALVPASPELVDRVTDELDLLAGAGSSDLRRGFRVLLVVIQWLPLFIVGAFSRMSELSLARRLAYLEALEHCRIGLLASLLMAFKIPMTMVAYELGPELRSTGFDRRTLGTRRALPMTRNAA